MIAIETLLLIGIIILAVRNVQLEERIKKLEKAQQPSPAPSLESKIEE